MRNERDELRSIIEEMRKGCFLREGITAREVANHMHTIAKSWTTPGDGWVSVEDRLPDTCASWVLVFANGAMNCMAWTDRGWEEWTGATCHNIAISEITHWMPLPEKPCAAKE